MTRSLLFLVALTVAGPACRKGAQEDARAPLRVAYFPNVTHAQALIGVADGTFEQALGPGRFAPRPFNAGPAAMEALLAGEVDVAYVGAGPATIAFLRSGGALRVVAGAMSGGAVLVVRDATRAADLAGKRVASPQIGNTQDIALRRWLAAQRLDVGGGPGQVNVTTLPNADILALFRRGQLAGAWVPEPWGARLVHEAGGRILVDERSLWPGGTFPTTVVVATRRALEARRGDVRALLGAHVAITSRWRLGPGAFASAANRQYGKLTGHELSEAVLRDAFDRLRPTTDPMRAQLEEEVRHARALGYAPPGDLTALVDDSVLREVVGEGTGSGAR